MNMNTTTYTLEQHNEFRRIAERDKDLPLLTSEHNWTMYFYELAARGLSYCIDDDIDTIEWGNSVDDNTLATMRAMAERFHQSKETQTIAWQCFGSRPCATCDQTTFVDNDQCSDCA